MPTRRPRRALPTLEGLEGRALMSTMPAAAHMTAAGAAAFYSFWSFGAAPPVDPLAQPFYIRNTKIKPGFGVGPPPAGGMTPAMIETAYSYPTTIAKPGLGQTIAIVDAFDDPNIAQDLFWFNNAFGLPQMNAGPGSPTFTKVQPQGRTVPDAIWAGEIALDVEWAHAIAPYANIMLVEAKSNANSDLFGGIDYAAAHGAIAISNSWGEGDFSGETAYDSHFLPTAHVVYLASSGDNGLQNYPSLAPGVLSVGGTSLNLNPNNSIASETGWAGSGGGLSSFEPTPSFQTTLGFTNRANPDISYNSDPNTGFDWYDTYQNGGWGVVGGTSDASPQWAALIAIADQQRAAISKAPLSTSQVQVAVYGMVSNTSGTGQLHDIVSGSNGNGSAGPGYDLVTGMGTPNDSRVIAALAAL